MLDYSIRTVGIPPKEYYNLTWYELQLLIQRHDYSEKVEVQREESEWARTRSIMTILINANRDRKKYPEPIPPEDILPLSFDKKKPKNEIKEPDLERIKKKYSKKKR